MRRVFCKVVSRRLVGRLAVLSALAFVSSAVKAETVHGTKKVWHPVTIDFEGPVASATDDAPNPFLDYRFQVRFSGPGGREYDVPGFFAGDGRGGARGGVWRVRFCPDLPGTWKYVASLRRGRRIAVDLDRLSGEPVAPDGASGSFKISARDPQAPGFLKWGRLDYVGGHYLKFADGPYWIRGGTDSPENFLAYDGFENTHPSHSYQAHRKHWRDGDPDWGDGRGKGIIGAINYLADRHVNSIYFLTMNIGGDGKDVWPWVGKPNRRGDPSNSLLKMSDFR